MGGFPQNVVPCAPEDPGPTIKSCGHFLYPGEKCSEFRGVPYEDLAEEKCGGCHTTEALAKAHGLR